ncbi:MAG: hypothetical protein PHX04_01645 [Bacilli bacterium]|nr:hypothetical protein [Bacilli bacterium]
MEKVFKNIYKVMSSKRFMLLATYVCIVLFAIISTIAFSEFTSSSKKDVANIKVADMNYNLKINGQETRIISVPANEETIATIIISSLNSVDSQYELIYEVCSAEDCDSLMEETPENLLVEYSTRTTDPVTDKIEAYESKVVRLGITNNTDDEYYLIFGINAGYIHNTLTLEEKIKYEYNEEDVTIAAIIEGTISTEFPTTSYYTATVECKTNKLESNASGSATWNGTKWKVTITGADSGKTVCNVYFNSPYNENKGVNRPVLFTGMTPVKWDDEFNETETTKDDSTWYDYNEKKWANAKTADGSYWVWIPRYAYQITSGYHLSTGAGEETAGTIDIEFLKKETNANESNTSIETIDYDSSTEGKNTSNNHFLHPAFDVEGSKLGFWVAKFEPSGTSDNINILPDEASLRKMTIGEQFDAAISMKTNTKYGWEADEVDPHMLTNLEWGAIAYLSKSAYGANAEVYINNNSDYLTGCAGDSATATSTTGCNAYNTSKGVYASTTHNIYGVYDMSGGAWERVSAYVGNGNANLQTYGQSILNADDKYKNIYEMGASDTKPLNYAANKNIYGDAIYETSSTGDNSTSWYGDYSSMPRTSNPWFLRGGNWDNGTNAGLFSFSNTDGLAGVYYTFRPVVRVG